MDKIYTVKGYCHWREYSLVGYARSLDEAKKMKAEAQRYGWTKVFYKGRVA